MRSKITNLLRQQTRVAVGMAVLLVGGLLFVPSFLIALVAMYFYIVGYIVGVIPRWTPEVVIAISCVGAAMIALGVRVINRSERRRRRST
jgi:membrane protein implicated in regulation of membrane protease activity